MAQFNMLKLKGCSLAVLGMMFFAGCATKVSFVSPETTPNVIKEVQTTNYYITDKVQFPPGVYAPEFKSEKGVYYRCPGKMIAGPLGMTFIWRGGLFIPFLSDKDQRHGVWFDHQDASGGLLGLGLTSPKKVWRLRQQINFEATSERPRAVLASP